MPDPNEPYEGTGETRVGGEFTEADSLKSTSVDPFATSLPTGPDNPMAAAFPVGSNAKDGFANESTEVDPYATSIPTGPSSPLDSAYFDESYATRTSVDGDDKLNPGNLTSTLSWKESGKRPGTAGNAAASRYRHLKLHARGGLGEVFVALDAELNREVALKEIQEKHLDRQECQLRFVFEAEVTGGLEHPGIVPVYGLGRYPDGRPYYAMRFIRGDSLKAAIKQFHGPVGRTEADLGHSLEFRQLVSRFVAVCHAIDYAHGRGVIHRDIKPDNIMLGPHGETLVVDWGLAKALSRPDPPDDTQPKPLRPLSGSDSSATMAGSVMGTPAFMSPEQAAGEVEALGPGSDIFSLGSTLYNMLTGHSPFRDKEINDLLEHVRKAEFPTPRSLNNAIPPALEAICLKAMALRPADRYPTAAALADDLERWLADEPVSAFAEPWTARFARWARRHRTAVAVAFALLMTASTALGIGTVLINKEKMRAERNHQRARSAVEQMLTLVGEVELADVPQMESIRHDLLDRALGFYREFLAERGTDSSSRPETGRALARLGDINELLGQYVEAEKDYREAIGLLVSSNSEVETRRALARTRTNLGILLKKSNRFVESEAVLREALRERQALASAHPDDADDARAASATLYQLGTLLAKLKDRSKEDEEFYREAIKDQEALVARPTNTAEDRRQFARFLNNLGILLSRSDPDEAEKTFLEASKIQDELQASSATNASFRWQRARTWNNLANLYARARLPQETADAFAKARAGFESLASDFPKVPDYRRELAMTLNNLAQLLELQPSDKEKPLDLLRAAEADQARLADQFPEVPDHRMRLAITRYHLGDLLRSTDPAGSAAALAGAVQLQEKLVADYPQVPEYQAALGRTRAERARSEAVQGQAGRGPLELLDKAIKIPGASPRGEPSRPVLRPLPLRRPGRSLPVLAQAGPPRRPRPRSRPARDDRPRPPRSPPRRRRLPGPLLRDGRERHEPGRVEAPQIASRDLRPRGDPGPP